MGKLIRFLTSYPMRCVVRRYFTDVVSGKPVGLYRDRHGNLFMAEHRWAAFRVRTALEGSPDET